MSRAAEFGFRSSTHPDQDEIALELREIAFERQEGVGPPPAMVRLRPNRRCAIQRCARRGEHSPRRLRSAGRGSFLPGTGPRTRSPRRTRSHVAEQESHMARLGGGRTCRARGHRLLHHRRATSPQVQGPRRASHDPVAMRGKLGRHAGVSRLARQIRPRICRGCASVGPTSGLKASPQMRTIFVCVASSILRVVSIRIVTSVKLSA